MMLAPLKQTAAKGNDGAPPRPPAEPAERPQDAAGDTATAANATTTE
jgi:hypothetical protein